MKVLAWRGPDSMWRCRSSTKPVGWLQPKTGGHTWQPSFVTPPLRIRRGTPPFRAQQQRSNPDDGRQYFPGGLGSFPVTMNQFLVFEDGPSINFELQWATYYDAANESALSRMWGGIHRGGRRTRSADRCGSGHSGVSQCGRLRIPRMGEGCGGNGFLPDIAGDFNADAVVNVGDFLILVCVQQRMGRRMTLTAMPPSDPRICLCFDAVRRRLPVACEHTTKKPHTAAFLFLHPRC